MSENLRHSWQNSANFHAWFCRDMQGMWLCYACMAHAHMTTHFLGPGWRKRPYLHQPLVIVCTPPCRCESMYGAQQFLSTRVCSTGKHRKNIANRPYICPHAWNNITRHVQYLLPECQARQHDMLFPYVFAGRAPGHLCICFEIFEMYVYSWYVRLQVLTTWVSCTNIHAYHAVLRQV